MVFDQVRQGRISDNIVAQIKKAIFTGVYRPGDKLPSEKELKDMFNVSRVPLREALRSLEEMRLIHIKTGVLGGAFVSEISTKPVSDSLSNVFRLGLINIRDIWEFRLLIEPNIVRLAAARRTNSEIKKMEDLISAREKSVKLGKTPVVASIDFHQAIARTCKNPLSILIMDTIGEILIEEFKKFNFSVKDHQSIIKFHKEILNCIKRENTQKVGQVMYSHLLDVKKRLKI